MLWLGPHFTSSLYISLMVIPINLSHSLVWMTTSGFSDEVYMGLGFRGANTASVLLCWWWHATVMFPIHAWGLPFEKHQPHADWNYSRVNIIQGRNLDPAILSMDHSVFLFFKDSSTHCGCSCFLVLKDVMKGNDKHVWMVLIKGWQYFVGQKEM